MPLIQRLAGAVSSVLCQLEPFHVMRIMRPAVVPTSSVFASTSRIADEIGATHVMEGSVRRDAERIRLTLQLIEARTDSHVWADTLDRPLAEAPALQGLVAREIAGALGVEMAEGGSGPATTVAAAYDLYLKAKLADGPEARVDALKLLDAALVLDPGRPASQAGTGRGLRQAQGPGFGAFFADIYAGRNTEH